MTDTLLAILAVELGFICAVGAAIFGVEIYSLWLRFKAIQEENKLTRIQVSPEQMQEILKSGALSLDKLGLPKSAVGTEAVKASGQYL